MCPRAPPREHVCACGGVVSRRPSASSPDAPLTTSFSQLGFVARGISSQTFFRAYLAVPLFTFACSLLFWPNSTLDNAASAEPAGGKGGGGGVSHSPAAGAGSPFLHSPKLLAGSPSLRAVASERLTKSRAAAKDAETAMAAPPPASSTRVDAPATTWAQVRAMLTRREYVFLTLFTGVHILKVGEGGRTLANVSDAGQFVQ